MNWFKRHSVCATCKVHFEPAPTERHAELCPEHRKPVVELEDRIMRVMDWAKLNWEKLEPQALEEYNKQNQKSIEALQAMYNQQMQGSSSGIGNLAGMIGL